MTITPTELRDMAAEVVKELPFLANPGNIQQMFTKAAIRIEQLESIISHKELPFKTLLEKCGESWADWNEEGIEEMIGFISDHISTHNTVYEIHNLREQLRKVMGKE